MNSIYIIAELSANHKNDLNLAKRTIRAMAESGANAVKVQTFTADSLSMNIENEFFGPLKSGPWKGIKPYDLFSEAALPFEWHAELKYLANSLGLDFFSSPFDIEAIDFLETLDVPMYKIASFEITDIQLIKYAASKNKPMLISTGVATEEDIKLAIETCHSQNNHDITLLKCTSEYPSLIEDANLRKMQDFKFKFNVKYGLSDHTIGNIVPIVATILGAEVIEKHFILDRSIGGPDSKFSMEPQEFKEMVDNCRKAEQTLGTIDYNVTEKDKLRKRSIWISNDIKKGENFTKENIKSIRPGNGLHPKYFFNVIGKKASRDIRKGLPLMKDMIEDNLE